MIPENELGVIVLFATQCAEREFEIVSIKSSFPDAIITHCGITYRAEFEYKASNFNLHRHDLRKADVIICWENDLLSESILPVLALSKPYWWESEIILPSDAEKEIAYWRIRALRAESQVRRIEKANQEDQSKESAGPTIVDFRSWLLEIGDSEVTLNDAIEAMAARGLDATEKNQHDKVGRWFRTEFVQRRAQ